MKTARTIAASLSPLCFLPSGRLVCYRYGRIVIYDGGKVVASHILFRGVKERFASRFRLLNRLLRLGVRAAIALDEETILLSVGQDLMSFNTNSGILSSELSFEQKIRPLAFSEIKSIKGFPDCICFGEYLSNKSKKPVSIHTRTFDGNWRVAYTFPDGAVNHIHNIVPDRFRNCVWVFTGDFGDSAAIWRATDGFGKVERVLYGNQQYRACIVNVLEEGLIYATDSPLDDNYIYLLDVNNSLGLSKLAPLDGSCIYGCQCGSFQVFESSVEPTGIYKNKLDFLFCWKKGPGIKNRYAHIYAGNPQIGFKEVYKEKKDILPFVFQFATFKFPAGNNKSSRLYFQPVATGRNDLKLMTIDL